MATRNDVLDVVAAAREAHRRVPGVVRRLMRYFDVTDGQLGLALGVKRQTVNSWLNGRTKIPDEFEEGMAASFGVDRHVLRMEPDDALRWVFDHSERVGAAVRANLRDEGRLLNSRAA